MVRPHLARCKGSGYRSQRTWNQNRQQCPFCDRFVYVTKNGYLEAHSPGDKKEALMPERKR